MTCHQPSTVTDRQRLEAAAAALAHASMIAHTDPHRADLLTVRAMRWIGQPTTLGDPP